MRRILLDMKIMLLANLWLVPVLAGLTGAVFYLVAPPPPMSAVMATGSEGGGYAQFGEKLKAVLAKQGFELILYPSKGSKENLQLLLEESGEVQLGLLQSGLEREVDSPQAQKLQSLGSIYQEPFWLFYPADRNIDRLEDLLQLRFAYGTEGSGTQTISQELLRTNGILPADYPTTWQAIGGKRAAKALLEKELDAGVFVGPAESPLIQQLAANPQLRLFDFHRTQAYEARLPYLRGVAVGEGLLNLQANSPRQDIHTLTPMATLVVNEEFNSALTALILHAAREVMQDGTLLDAPGAFPNPQPKTFTPSEDAERYYKNGLPLLQRYLPFRIASLADRYIILLIPLLMVLFPLFKAIGPLYRWRIRARIYRWYKHLREIDRQIDNGTLADHLDSEIAQLEQMQDQLAKVEVPLSYSSELYDLHVHLRYVIERLHTLRQQQQTS